MFLFICHHAKYLPDTLLVLLAVFFMNELTSTFQSDVLFLNHKHKTVLNFLHVSLHTQRFPLSIYIIQQEREVSVCLEAGAWLAHWFLLFPCICCGFTQRAKHLSKLWCGSLVVLQAYCLLEEKKLCNLT